MEWKIALSEPDIGQEEIEAVTRVLKNKWLTLGPVTGEFEQKFADKMNVKHAIAVNNCTAALHLANLALEIGKGDEVICPALTFVASANVVSNTGADVIFADVVSEEELTINPSDIEARVTEKTRAITVVHYAGFACLMEEILSIARKYHLRVIEDCAHSPFAQYQFKDGTKKFVGTLGDVGCFSFFGNKNMTTGEGGMITTNNDELADKIRLLRSHGMTTLTYERYKGGATGYDVIAHGYNYRTDDIHSAIGVCQLEKIDILNQKRRCIYQWYIDSLKSDNNIIVPFTHRELAQSTCHIMPIIIKENYQEIRQKLNNAGIQTSKHYQLIPNFSAYVKNNKFKSRIAYIDNILTLPLFPTMTRDDIALISQLVRLDK